MDLYGQPEGRAPSQLSAGSAVALAVVMLLLFAVSVWIRLPHIGRPLGDGHEWLTSTVVRNLQIWEEDGALKHRFLPIFTYSGASNKFINNQGSEHMDAAGNYYYTSYGPLAYIVPYVVLKAFRQPITVLGVQCFNLGVHLATAVLVFFLVVEVVRPKRFVEFAAPLAAYVFYVFSAATLWLHSNVYMADMFVQPLWVLSALLVLRYSDAPDPSWRLLAAISGAIAATITAEWIGVFFAVALGVYALLQREPKRKRGLLLATAMGIALGIGLIVLHYSMVNGIDGFLASSAAKFAVRSGLGSESTFAIGSLESWIAVVRNYGVAYGVVPGAIIVTALTALAAIALHDRRRGVFTDMWRRGNLVLALSAGSVALHHLVFFDFTAVHFFATLKTAVVFALVMGLVAYRALSLEVSSGKSSPFGRVVLAAVLTMLGVSVVSGVATYKRHERDWRNDMYMRAGTVIAARALPDECVFLRDSVTGAGTYVLPQVVLYAHRNIASWESTVAAVDLMNRQGVQRGIVFSVDPASGVVGYERFALSD